MNYKYYSIYVNGKFVNSVSCGSIDENKDHREELLHSEFCKDNKRFIDVLFNQLTIGKWAGIKIDIIEN